MIKRALIYIEMKNYLNGHTWLSNMVSRQTQRHLSHIIIHCIVEKHIHEHVWMWVGVGVLLSLSNIQGPVMSQMLVDEYKLSSPMVHTYIHT